MPRPKKTESNVFDTLIEQLAAALAQRLVAAMRSEGGGRAKGAARSAQAPSAAGAPRGRRRKGQKRDPEFIAKTTQSLLEYIESHDGERIEQIAKALRVKTKDLKLPAMKLLASRKVKTRGEKRGTKYYAT